MLAVFLAALDQTIAAVALPTIVKDIGGESGYSWVGSAYLLSKLPIVQTARQEITHNNPYSVCMWATVVPVPTDSADRKLGLSPLYGKLSDLVGRKPVLFFSISVFLLGSALCGAAQSFIWLALCKCEYMLISGSCGLYPIIGRSWRARHRWWWHYANGDDYHFRHK